jgi:hypothetical protein
MICAMTPPIDAPTTCARSMCLGVEHRERVGGHLEQRRRDRAARRSGRCRGCRARTQRWVPPERAPLERPAPMSRHRGPGSSAPATVAAAEDVVVDRDAVAGHDLRHRSPLRVPNSREQDAREREPTLDRVPLHSVRAVGPEPEAQKPSRSRWTFSRAASASSAAASGSPEPRFARTGSGVPIATRHGRTGRPNGPPGRTATGMTG